MSNLRNSHLLHQVESHPLKATLAKALDIAEAFAGDMQFVQLNKDFSPQGKQKAMQANLRKAVRDLRDARAPLNELQTKLDAKRKAVSMPAFDPTDVVGFLRRQELRAALRSMPEGQRALLLTGAGAVPEFADAMLEQNPLLSGLLPAENFVVEAAKKDRLTDWFGPQLAEIDELEKTIADANMIIGMARVDLQTHSQMDQSVFEEFVKPIETRQNAPWLLKHPGDTFVQVVEITPDGKANYRPAVPEEIREGVFFKDMPEYLASRAA